MVGQLTGLECNKGCMQSSQKTKMQNGLVKSLWIRIREQGTHIVSLLHTGG